MTVILIILAILFFLYGFLVKAVGSGTKFFLVWIMLGVLAGAAAVMTGKDLWKHIPAGARRGLLVAAVACMCVTVGISAMILRGFGSKGEENLDDLF